MQLQHFAYFDIRNKVTRIRLQFVLQILQFYHNEYGLYLEKYGVLFDDLVRLSTNLQSNFLEQNLLLLTVGVWPKYFRFHPLHSGVDLWCLQ